MVLIDEFVMSVKCNYDVVEVCYWIVCNISIGSMIFVLLIFVIGGVLLVVVIICLLCKVVIYFECIVEGKLIDEIDVLGCDEFGVLLCNLVIMQVMLKVMLDEIGIVFSVIDQCSKEFEKQMFCVVE